MLRREAIVPSTDLRPIESGTRLLSVSLDLLTKPIHFDFPAKDPTMAAAASPTPSERIPAEDAMLTHTIMLCGVCAEGWLWGSPMTCPEPGKHAMDTAVSQTGSAHPRRRYI
eukprot:gb/GECG01001608.1/.p1 GENE.gb/GECG01001608.1/~~gb/GECG01001608.1/.p1  ORF type:complete len:112 (+),score=4.60 gb/GECG01001608.1/:1-336(+)